MTRLVRFSNNAVSNLAANLLVGGTSLSVTSGDGAKFPTLSAGQYFMATLVKADGSTEVVKVTARSTDTMTIVRAAEPVAGASTAYAFSAGDRIEARLTAGVLGNEIDRLDAAAIIGTLNKNADYTVQEADVTSLIRVDTSGGTRTITLPDISSLTADFDILVDKVTGDANPVTIARQGSDTINGGSVYTLTAQYQSAWVVADRSTNTWSVIQSSSNGVGINAIVDEGTGSGASTITLTADPGSINNVDVVIGGVPQLKSTMSLSGTTLTVGGAIASGVKWMAKYCVPLSIGTPADGTVTTAKLASSAVTTAKIADANVTTAKIADANVTAAKLSSGAAVGNIGFTPVDPASLAGQVAFFAKNTAPSGWLKANGAAVSRTTYAVLFAVIDTTFGAGDGSTTFNLPDLRGEFPRGWDDGRGVDSGRGIGTAQNDAFQGHWHQKWDAAYNQHSQGGSTFGAESPSGNTAQGPNDAVRGAVTDGVNGTPRTAAETRPRNVALLACIKY